MRFQLHIAAFCGVLGAVIVAGGTAGARAGTISETYNFDFGNDHFVQTATTASGLFAFNDKVSRSQSFAQFDSSLGTLQSVSFSISTGGTNVFGATHDGV